MRDIKELQIIELEALLQKWGQPSFRARQVFSWIYQKGAQDFDAMSNLPSLLRAKLKESFSIATFKLARQSDSCDGTKKFLFELNDGALIETVAIPAQMRLTGCVSSQIGCKYACAFCASGTRGFKRDLAYNEILEEVLLLKNAFTDKALTHIVFMGTGEPFDNYDNVLRAIRFINAADGFHVGARRITISTCGIIPGIERLALEKLQVELSVSLHAADDATRTRLMPVNRRYPLVELMRACRRYAERTGRQVTFEYIMLKGINSDLQSARKLGTMLKGFESKVNLIPGNPVKELGVWPPLQKDVLLFRDALAQSGAHVTLRQARGQDIDAACGQLKINHEESLH
jgi:23S rRNA (adenine2503-C2)-methyltransferase